MLITDITPVKKGHCGVFVDGSFYCSLQTDILAVSRLKTGSEICVDEIEALRRDSEEKTARERALWLLARRSYTSKGLYEKLVGQTGEEAAEKAVRRMLELGLLDDGDYARRFAADCIKLKGYSHRKTAQELYRKGIDKDLAHEVLAEFEEDPGQAIAKLILTKYSRYLSDEKGVQKAIGALMRRGYDYGDIRRVIESLNEYEEYYD